MDKKATKRTNSKSSTEAELTEEEKKEMERIRREELIHQIEYSDKYSDDIYEYRHVTLPRDLLHFIPRQYWDTSGERMAMKLLSEDEWRGIGVLQSMGWEHYEVHAPEPQIMLFRRPKNYDVHATRAKILRGKN